jgi:hypothetical protein
MEQEISKKNDNEFAKANDLYYYFCNWLSLRNIVYAVEELADR